MTLQKVLSRVRQAVEDYHMIEEGDRIAVGISGGKDSLTLLLALNELRKFYPQKFSIYAVTVDLGFQNLDLNEIRALCASHEIPYTVVETSIAKIVFEDRRENNPCSLCAKMRKGALNDAIKDLGCNKIAYAHHEDDVVETMMLSLFYEGDVYKRQSHDWYRPVGLLPDVKYHFYGRNIKYNLKDFGDLVNTVSPIHIKQG